MPNCSFNKFFPLILILLAACQKNQEKKFLVGISQLGDSDAWRTEMKAEIDRELVFNPDIMISYKQANYNSAIQVKQIQELMEEKIDLLIVSANEATPLTPIIDSLYNSGIPVITVDRTIYSGSYTSFIGADNVEVGRLAAQYGASFLNKRGGILQITGLQSSTPARQRQQGFMEEIAQYPEISVTTVQGNWLAGSVENLLMPLSNKLQDIQLIFAHNDVMASTAAAVCKKMGFPDIKIIGVDAQPGIGLQFIENKTMMASVHYPTGGLEAIRTAAKILHKEPVPKMVPLSTFIVDSTNVIMLQQQFNKIISQQKDIGRQTKLLQEQAKTFRSQRNLIFFLIGSLTLLIMLAGLLIYLRKKNIKANKLLRLQNNEIRSKSEQISSMAEQVQASSEQRINFFTNISHELKTPLTLILAPTEESLKNPKLPAYIRSHFLIIRKNASRLLLLVNQLMDFRKLELNKMDIRVQEIDMIPFITEILSAFEGLAKQHRIDCRLITKEPGLKLWIDPEKIEKVFFNILSNAFKCTADEGRIYVHVEEDKTNETVIIKIEDTGFGLSKMDLERLFEFFYQGNNQSMHGTGIGLALSKELLELHSGTINVESEKNRGTIFTIKLLSGNSHYKQDQIRSSSEWGYSSEINTWLSDYRYSLDTISSTFPSHADSENLVEKEATILVIEDNEDLSNFLAHHLRFKYNIITANNGTEGIRKTFEELPDLILSDIMMPSTDGLQLSKVLKTDIRTNHIPIILLTAKTTDENKIEGLRNSVDAYITKPFNLSVIEATISNLLDNRVRLRNHITTEIPKEISGLSGKFDKQFLSKFNAIIEQNISNENFSVQDICKQLSMSKIQLYRKTKPLLNSGINEYILNLRIQKAKFLLLNEQLSLSEIAGLTGFSNPSYFSTSFKKATGETPKSFKQKKG